LSYLIPVFKDVVAQVAKHMKMVMRDPFSLIIIKALDVARNANKIEVLKWQRLTCHGIRCYTHPRPHLQTPGAKDELPA
jgi:hypothetical protein